MPVPDNPDWQTTVIGPGGAGLPTSPIPVQQALTESYLSQITSAADLVQATQGPQVVQMGTAVANAAGGGNPTTLLLAFPASFGNVLVFVLASEQPVTLPAGVVLVGAISPCTLAYYLAQGGETSFVFEGNAPAVAAWEVTSASVPEIGDFFAASDGDVPLAPSPVAFCGVIGGAWAIWETHPTPTTVTIAENDMSDEPTAIWQQTSSNQFDVPDEFGTVIAAGSSTSAPAAGTERAPAVTFGGTTPLITAPFLLFLRPTVLGVGFTRIFELGVQGTAGGVATIARNDSGEVLASSFGGLVRKVSFLPTGRVVPNSVILVADPDGAEADFWAVWDVVG